MDKMNEKIDSLTNKVNFILKTYVSTKPNSQATSVSNLGLPINSINNFEKFDKDLQGSQNFFKKNNIIYRMIQLF